MFCVQRAFLWGAPAPFVNDLMVGDVNNKEPSVRGKTLKKRETHLADF